MKAQIVQPVAVRWMIRRDYDEVLLIDEASFAHPWDEARLAAHLQQRDIIGMVCERQERVVGHIVYRLGKQRLEIVRLAVHPADRRRGLATQMIDKLRGKLSAKEGRDRIVATVPESLLPAHLFLRACGFRATQILAGWHDDTGEDAYRFVWKGKVGP